MSLSLGVWRAGGVYRQHLHLGLRVGAADSYPRPRLPRRLHVPVSPHPCPSFLPPSLTHSLTLFFLPHPITVFPPSLPLFFLPSLVIVLPLFRTRFSWHVCFAGVRLGLGWCTRRQNVATAGKPIVAPPIAFRSPDLVASVGFRSYVDSYRPWLPPPPPFPFHPHAVRSHT
eukprot:2575996-Rhodomonas_salina.5